MRKKLTINRVYHLWFWQSTALVSSFHNRRRRIVERGYYENKIEKNRYIGGDYCRGIVG